MEGYGSSFESLSIQLICRAVRDISPHWKADDHKKLAEGDANVDFRVPFGTTVACEEFKAEQ